MSDSLQRLRGSFRWPKIFFGGYGPVQQSIRVAWDRSVRSASMPAAAHAALNHATLSSYERMPMLVQRQSQKSNAGGVLMDAPIQDFTFAASLEELKAKGGWLCTASIVRSSLSTTADASSRSTIVAPTWASRSSTAVSTTGS